MTESFCVGGGRRLQGSSKSGPGKGGSRKEVQLPLLQDPPKLGEELREKSLLEDTDSQWQTYLLGCPEDLCGVESVCLIVARLLSWG